MEYDSEYDDESSHSSQTPASDATRVEVASIMGEQFELPQGLAENADIFKEFLSIPTWLSLNSADHAYLQQFLPSFPENDAYEKNVTLRRLFNRENFKFGSPFITFHNNLKKGHYRPDIAHLRYLMKKAERKQYREQKKRHCFELLKEVIVGRREVLEAAYNSPLGPIRIPKNYYSNNPAVDPILQRVKRRYFQELSAVRSEVGEYSQSSEDENYQDGAPRMLSKKQKQKLSILESSLNSSDMTMVISTMSTKPSGFDLESNVTVFSNPYEINEEQFRKMLLSHKRRRMNNEKHVELNTSGITLHDVTLRTQYGHKRFPSKLNANGLGNHNISADKQKKRSGSACNNSQGHKSKSVQENFDVHISNSSAKKNKKHEVESDAGNKSNESTDDEVSSAILMSEPEKNIIDVEYSSPTNIPQNQKLIGKQILEQKHQKIGESNGAAAAAGQAEPKDSTLLSVTENEKINDVKYRRTSELVQDTHVSFFSLLRDIICSSPNHRMTLERIEHHLKSWESNPISPLNDWFTLVDEPWTTLLESALSFLSADYPDLQPNDFVPYIEYKPQIQSYQWIGAGRDSDSHLLNLCSHWLDRKDDIYQSSVIEEGGLNEEFIEESIEEIDEPREESIDEYVPPPRCPTNWIVRLSTDEEKKIFQVQERARFENPHKAFTYKMHGYESVVGPVKGVYNSQTCGSVLKPRGHNLLTLNRPNYVTILALVRDAAARLPNGEGTRADICILMRDSQYLDLSEAADNTLQSVVSGALDRLHYEVDACVKFDTKRKIWIYLHRRRSEAEMEKIHQQYQGMAKTSKKTSRKKVMKQLEGADAKERESSAKDGNDGKRKPKPKSGMVVQPMLKNVDAQIFQNVAIEPKIAEKKETSAETKIQDFMVIENQVLDDFMNMGTCESYDAGADASANLVTVRNEKVNFERENGEAKMKAAAKANKMPGQSLLNQDLLNKNALVQSAGVRFLKAKQGKPAMVNVLSSAERLQSAEGSSSVVGHILKSDARPQEIITSAGKKIIIQTGFTGNRTPVKFVNSNTNQLGRKVVVTKPSSSPQVQRLTTALSKVTSLPQQQIRTAGNQQQENTIHGVVRTTPAAQFVQNSNLVATQVKSLSAGTQFLTATGQKVQIIASAPQNLGQIQSIHLGSGQNILASNVHTAAGSLNTPSTNLMGNIQQVQLLTSTGQLITKALPSSGMSEDKTSEIKIAGQGVKMNPSGGTAEFTTIRNAIGGQHLQMAISKSTGPKGVKNIKMVTCQPAIADVGGKSISLLAASQQKQAIDKKDSKDQKLFVTKSTPQVTGKLGTQLLNVSSVQLLNSRSPNQSQMQALTKPLINKTGTPILTGVKLVNTQQGVKMVATSSTVVQNAIQPGKTATHISKISPTISANSGAATKSANRPAQIISMESLLQNAGHIRVASAGKGTANLIQIPSSSDGVTQFAVVSQGNVISVSGQPRVIQAQQLANASQNQTQLATSAAMNPGKAIVGKTTPSGQPPTSGVRMGSTVNLATIAGKPMILTGGAKAQPPNQNVILTSQNAGGNQAIVLTQGNVRAPSSSGTVTLVQQGATQQILLPAGFQGGTINLKSLPGVKVIPFAGATQKGRQQVYARIVKSPGRSSPQPPVADKSLEEL